VRARVTIRIRIFESSLNPRRLGTLLISFLVTVYLSLASHLAGM
jgi:hypothetical protein